MAERRMFSKTIIDSDDFLEMPLTTQSLYFHLSMRADDDGFVNNPMKIQRMIGAYDDDRERLISKNFIIPFASGIVVIRHWKIHNYIQKDRYKGTLYKDEKDTLFLDENRVYTEKTNPCIQNVSNLDTQYRLGKDRLGKDSIVEDDDATAPETDKNLSEAVKAYESNIGTISEKAIDGITEWLEKGADISLIIFAIEQAAEYNARNWKYADTVISNHYNAGRKTKADAEVFGKSIKKASSSKKDAPNDGYVLDDMAAIERKARLERMKGNIDNGQA